MNFGYFQKFIEVFCANAYVPVDLVNIAKNLSSSTIEPKIKLESCYKQSKITPNILYLVIDGEGCLDRLYGGFFCDWVCGGQWNRTLQFLRHFFRVASRSNIEFTVFFNGALELSRMNCWIKKQLDDKEKIKQVLRHSSHKGTPPPKAFWIAPNGLRTCLRMILRQLKVNVVLTTTDHHQEVMTYLKKHNYHGLLADDPEYIVFNPPRYFSSKHLKLTFKGCLETKECMLSDVARFLKLHPSHMRIVTALLGNHILTDLDLSAFHHSLLLDTKEKITPIVLIQEVLGYVRNLNCVDDLNKVAQKVFGPNSEENCDKFMQCILYYSASADDKTKGAQFSNSYADCHKNFHQDDLAPDIHQKKSDGDLMCQGKFASETLESEKAIHEDFYQLISDHEHFERNAATNFNLHGPDEETFLENSIDFAELDIHMSSLSLIQDKQKESNSSTSNAFVLPKVSKEVMCVSRERHQKGFMHPCIFQILSQGEIKIPVTFEDDNSVEFSSTALLFRPLRQMVYYILFNEDHSDYLSKPRKEKDFSEDEVPDVRIKEWVWSCSKQCYQPDYVLSIPLGWPIPSIKQLWFNSSLYVNKIRLQAFLTCMHSNTSLMYDPLFVPEHLIILCCVLRYMLCSPKMPILRKCELDAFLVQALDPHLMDTAYSQNLEVPSITPRGVMLAAVFMNGVDHALMANDACGAPIPWFRCCPWLFFDGKIFHCKLLKANSAKNLMELCDNREKEMSAVDHMRNAIFEDIKIEFLPSQMPFNESSPTVNNCSVSVHSYSQGRGRGFQGATPRSKQQENADGRWNRNSFQGPRLPNPNCTMPPQILSFRGVGCGQARASNVPRGLGVGQSLRGKGFSPCRKPKDSLSITKHARGQARAYVSGGGIGRGQLARESSPSRTLEVSSPITKPVQGVQAIPNVHGVGRGLVVCGYSQSKTPEDPNAKKNRPRLGMGRGALPLEDAKQEFYDLGFEL